MGKGGRNATVKRNKKLARHKDGFAEWNITPLIAKEHGDFLADARRARDQFVKQQKKERHDLVQSMSREEWHKVRRTHDSAFSRQLKEFTGEQLAAFKEHLAQNKLKKAKRDHIKSGKDINDFEPPVAPPNTQPSKFEISVTRQAREHLKRENRNKIRGTRSKAREVERDLLKKSKKERLAELKKHYTALQHLREKWHAEANAKRALKEAKEAEQRAEKEMKKQAEKKRRKMEKALKAAEAEREAAEAAATEVAGKQAVEEEHVQVKKEIKEEQEHGDVATRSSTTSTKVKKEESSDDSSEEEDSDSDASSSDDDSSDDNSDSSEASDSEEESSDSDTSSSEDSDDELEMPKNETSKKSSDNSSSSDDSSDPSSDESEGE